MKKYFTTNSYKKYNTSHAASSLRQKIRFREYKRKWNKALIGLNETERIKKPSYNNRFKDYEKVYAPEQFSFIEYPDKVIDFISTLQSLFDRKKSVFIEMAKVKFIDYDAIVVLLSIMVKFKSNKIPFNGSSPDDTNAKQIFLESGFLPNLYKEFIDTDRYNIMNGHKIHTHAWTNVDSELPLALMEEISPFIHNEKRVYKGLGRSLIELMQNCHNHATIEEEGVKHWWLSVNIQETSRKATFSFIDYGVGIFTSLENKKEDSKWYGWGSKFVKLFAYQNNAELLKLILDGHLHSTVTGQHFRGKGLPGIKEALDRNLISRLYIISNNVYANVGEGIYKTLPQSFDGTFIYWEVNEHTINHPWIQ